jgi:hypothetical protein
MIVLIRPVRLHSGANEDPQRIGVNHGNETKQGDCERSGDAAHSGGIDGK